MVTTPVRSRRRPLLFAGALALAILLLGPAPFTSRAPALAQETTQPRSQDTTGHSDQSSGNDRTRGRRPDDRSTLLDKILQLGDQNGPLLDEGPGGNQAPAGDGPAKGDGGGKTTEGGSVTPTGDTTSTQTRTRDPNCDLRIEFGVRVVGPEDNAAAGDDEKKAPWHSILAGVRGGLSVPSNYYLELVVRHLGVGPLPGTLTFTFFRGPAGQTPIATTPSPFAFDLPDAAAVAKFNAKNNGNKAPQVEHPAGVAPKTPASELIRMVAVYKPKNIDKSCEVNDQVVVRWFWNGATGATSSTVFQPPNIRIKVPPSGSRVVSSQAIIDETTGFPGKINKATPTVVIFHVKDLYGCCGTSGRAYAIIQFVRHTWKLGDDKEAPPDPWNLDGSEQQSILNDRGQPYDPTYTNNPGKDGNDLVQAGPWDGNPAPNADGAISVYDFPGLLKDAHELFLKEGGYMKWEFVTLLVCLEKPPDAKTYKTSGLVEAVSHYTITRTYTPNPGAKTTHIEVAVQEVPKNVAGDPIGPSATFKACVPLKTLLKQWGLDNAYDKPRSHVVKLR